MRKIIITLLVMGIVGWYAGAALADVTDTINVTATVQTGTSTVNIDEASVAFGSISGTVGNHRFTAGPMTIDYFAANDAWTIRVSTNNHPGDDGLDEGLYAGLEGVVDDTQYAALKVWNGNYGPTASQPDEDNDYFFAGYDFNGDTDKEDTITDGTISEVALGFDVNGDGDALDVGLGTVGTPVTEAGFWLRIVEQDEHDDGPPGDPYTWRRLTYAGAELDAAGFENYLGVDVQGVAPQAYATTLTVEIIHQ
ncbi:MAG: hypothetical protein HQ547_04990 [Candidatus Omnitrophica bacterium]|nr:hypothetical protein [Candidatus Omnitrophota bacterium]